MMADPNRWLPREKRIEIKMNDGLSRDEAIRAVELDDIEWEISDIRDTSDVRAVLYKMIDFLR